MSQQIDDYSFLTGRIRDLLVREYGFREHWCVEIANNISRGAVSVVLTLRQLPNQVCSGDMSCGFDTPRYLFPEFSVVRESVLECAPQIINRLRYRNWQDNHPPQVKIYCWLQEYSQEVRDRYMVPEHRPVSLELPFSNSVHLQILIQNLLRDVVGGTVVVNSHQVRIGESGSIGEVIFHSARSLSRYVNQLQMNRPSAPAVVNQPRPNIRKVEL